ncbi:MAG TPA: hypothetical protein VGL53_24515 [Bryobacteraceae bacterium]|jgi:hypothetical protein
MLDLEQCRILELMRQDLKLVILFTSHWILYGVLAVTVLAVIVSAIKGATS